MHAHRPQYILLLCGLIAEVLVMHHNTVEILFHNQACSKQSERV